MASRQILLPKKTRLELEICIHWEGNGVPWAEWHSMKWVYRMMPELADHIPWAQDYDIGVQIDWEEDMEEEVMRRETSTFYCPTKVVEWVGKLPAKMERDCSRALNDSGVFVYLIRGPPPPGA